MMKLLLGGSPCTHQRNPQGTVQLGDAFQVRREDWRL